MREITKLMINKYKIKELGYDFMGYSLQKGDLLTFHHLIIPRRNCHKMGLEDGYFEWNGAILYTTPHEYLHVIESRDYDMYAYITSEMIDENTKGYLDTENIKRIHDVLNLFEREYCSDTTRKGKILIKEEYTKRRKYDASDN